MDLQVERVKDLILVSLDPTNPSFSTAQQEIFDILTLPSSIMILMSLIEGSGISHSAMTYFEKSIRSHWNQLDDPSKEHVKSFLVRYTPNEDDLNLYTSAISHIFHEDKYEWPNLVEFLFTSYTTNANTVSAILSEICDDMEPNFYQDNIFVIFNIVTFFLEHEQLSIRIRGVHIFTITLSQIDSYEAFNEFSTILGICEQSDSLSQDLYTLLWTDINTLIGSQKLPEEIEHQLINISYREAIKPHVTTKRMLPLTALINGMKSMPDQLPQTLSLTLDISTQIIKETSSIPLDMLDIYDQILSTVDKQTSYPVLIQAVFEYSDNPTSSLTLLKSILSKMPEQAHKHLSDILQTVLSVYETDDPIAIQTASSIIETLANNYSQLKVHTFVLLQTLIPYLISDSPEVRHHTYLAVLSILDNLDTPLKNLFSTLFSISNKIYPDDQKQYYAVLAYGIELDMSLSEQAIEDIYSLIQNPESLVCATALLKVDEEHLPGLLYQIEQVLTDTDNPDVTRFLLSLLEISPESVEPYIESHYNNMMTTSSQLSASLVSLYSEKVSISKYSTNILKITLDNLDTKNESLRKEAFTTINSLFSQLVSEDRIALVTRLEDIVIHEIDISYVCLSINSLSMLHSNYDLLQKIIRGDIALLGGLPLIETETNIPLFEAVTQYIESLVASDETSVNEEILTFLIDLLERDSELEKSLSVSSLSEIIRVAQIDDITRDRIINSLQKVLFTAEDNSLRENLVYLIDVFVTCFGDTMEDIENVIMQWWDASENSRGLRDNIAALMVSLSCIRPLDDTILQRVLTDTAVVVDERIVLICGNLLKLVGHGYSQCTKPYRETVRDIFQRVVKKSKDFREYSSIISDIRNWLIS